jgi:hypothetical protein
MRMSCRYSFTSRMTLLDLKALSVPLSGRTIPLPVVTLHSNPGKCVWGPRYCTQFPEFEPRLYLKRFFRTFGAASKPLRSANPLSIRE